MYRRNNNGPENTALRHSQNNLNLFTPTTIHHNVLWSVWKKLCQYRQHRTSNTHWAWPKENAWWLTLSKAALKSICTIQPLPTLQCTLLCVELAQKCITGTQTFPISKRGGWKHTIALHKLSKTNRHQALKHLSQYWCYGNRSVIGSSWGWWTNE